MANLSITIENGLNVWGPAPSSKWGDWNWNTLIWGEGNEDLQVWVVTQHTSNELALTTSIYRVITKTIGQTLSLLGDMGSEVLSNNDWVYNYPDRATDAEDRDPVDWTESGDSTTAWTESTDGSTDWS